jgi:hypothetical protein
MNAFNLYSCKPSYTFYTVYGAVSYLFFTFSVLKPLNYPTKEVANKTGYSLATVKRWKQQQLTRESLERAGTSGRPSKVFPAWASVTIRNIIIGKPFIEPRYTKAILAINSTD